MKTGTITFHAAHNFGSVLQAYALQQTVLQIAGHNEIINYRPKVQKQMYRVITKRPKFVAILKDITHLLYYKSLKVKYQKFEYFIHHNLILSQKEFDSLESLSKELSLYDCYISGSDQIWNPNPCDFSMAYLLPFIPEKSKRISYAASMGPSGIFTRPLPQGYVESLARYKYISVRENKSALLIQNLLLNFNAKTNFNKLGGVKIVCDPVFLFSKQEWVERLIGRVPILKK